MFRHYLISPVVVLACVGHSLLAQEEPQDKKKVEAAPVLEAVGNYKQDKPSENLRTKPADEGKVRSQVQKMLRGELALSGADADIFNNYYNLFKFPMLTLADAESLRKLPEERAKFFREHLEDTKAIQPVHNHLADIALEYFLRVANENYHPAVRFNAMTIIGLLNDQEKVTTGAQKMNPEPFTRALQPMVTAFEREDQLDLVRLAALTGIVRHIELDSFRLPNDRIPEQLRNDVLALLTKLAQQKQPPPERTAGGHLWMRSKAIEGLGYSQFNKAVLPTVEVLDGLIGDEKEAISIRVAAAHALGRANWSGGLKYDVQASLGRISDLLSDIFAAEKSRFELERKRAAEAVGPVSALVTAGGGSGGGRIVRGPEGGGVPGYDDPRLTISADPYAYRIEASRRRLRAWLNSLDLALRGIDFRGRPVHAPPTTGGAAAAAAAAASAEPRGLASLAKAGPDQKALDAVQKEIDRMIKKVENETAEIQDRKTYEKELQAALEQLGKGGKPAAVAPGGVAAPAAENALDPAPPAAAVVDPLEGM